MPLPAGVRALFEFYTRSARPPSSCFARDGGEAMAQVHEVVRKALVHVSFEGPNDLRLLGLRKLKTSYLVAAMEGLLDRGCRAACGRRTFRAAGGVGQIAH